MKLLQFDLGRLRNRGKGKLPPTIVCDAQVVTLPKPKAPPVHGLMSSLGMPFSELHNRPPYPRSSKWAGIRVLKYRCHKCRCYYLEMLGVGIHSDDKVCDVCLFE
jgi:hypothetical protein